MIFISFVFHFAVIDDDGDDHVDSFCIPLDIKILIVMSTRFESHLTSTFWSSCRPVLEPSWGQHFDHYVDPFWIQVGVKNFIPLDIKILIIMSTHLAPTWHQHFDHHVDPFGILLDIKFLIIMSTHFASELTWWSWRWWWWRGSKKDRHDDQSFDVYLDPKWIFPWVCFLSVSFKPIWFP